MTTYGTYDIDTVPAPSDYELMPRVTRLIGFNHAARLMPICRDRWRFHEWLKRNEIDTDGVYTEDQWWSHYDHFVEWEDARDLIDTQADALI